MATKELERAFRDFRLGDPASCAFRSQLAGEKLTKSLLLLFGVQFEKTHEPAVLLGRYLARANVSTDVKKTADELISDELILESQGTLTRYGVETEGMLVAPEKVFTKEKAKTVLETATRCFETYFTILKLLNVSETVSEEVEEAKTVIEKGK
jgi:HEPN domain-containing protein